jgi:hypothetical protein
MCLFPEIETDASKTAPNFFSAGHLSQEIRQSHSDTDRHSSSHTEIVFLYSGIFFALGSDVACLYKKNLTEHAFLASLFCQAREVGLPTLIGTAEIRRAFQQQSSPRSSQNALQGHSTAFNRLQAGASHFKAALPCR